MKKIIMTMLLCLFTAQTYAVEKNIAFYVGHSNGGGSAGMQTIIQQELKNKGWKVDFKVIGNCGNVINLMETSDKPILAGWGPDWNTSVDNVCYNPPTKKNFMRTFINTPRLLCGPYDDLAFDLVPGQRYRVGVNQGQNHDVFLESLGEKLNVNFKVIEYKNSGFIKRAMQAKEIDAWYTTAGLPQHAAKTQKCLYGTIAKEWQGVVPLKTLISTVNVNTSWIGFLLVNDKVDGELKTMLKNDLEAIITSKDYRGRLAAAGFGDFITNDSDEQQISLIMDTTEAFKK